MQFFFFFFCRSTNCSVAGAGAGACLGFLFNSPFAFDASPRGGRWDHIVVPWAT